MLNMLKNVIIIGCIPGLKEPKKNVNTFLKPVVKELQRHWEGVYLETSSLFSFIHKNYVDLQLLHHSKVAQNATRSFHVKSLAKNLITLDLTEMTGQLEHILNISSKLMN